MPVNLQRGEFYRGWKGTGPRKAGDSLRSTVTNTSAVAPFVLRGTRRMQARPFGPAIRARIKGSRARRHRRALAAVHTGG